MRSLRKSPLTNDNGNSNLSTLGHCPGESVIATLFVAGSRAYEELKIAGKEWPTHSSSVSVQTGSAMAGIAERASKASATAMSTSEEGQL